MAQTITLTDLIAGCRLDAEIPDSISDANLIIWINRAARDLTAFIYDINPRWGLTSDTVSLTGTETYSLPSDFYKMRDAYVGTPTSGRRLHEIPISQRFVYLNNVAEEYLVYYLRGDTEISILPTTTTGTLTLFYVPTLAAMTTGTDTFNGRFGWEEYIYAWVGMKFMRRLNDRTDVWERSMDKIESRIRTQIANMNLSGPRQARNTDAERLAEQDLLLWT